MQVSRWDVFKVYRMSPCLRSPTFACSMALLAEIQCYTTTSLITHYHAQQDSEEEESSITADSGTKLVNPANFVLLMNGYICSSLYSVTGNNLEPITPAVIGIKVLCFVCFKIIPIIMYILFSSLLFTFSYGLFYIS